MLSINGVTPAQGTAVYEWNQKRPRFHVKNVPRKIHLSGRKEKGKGSYIDVYA